MYRLIPLFLVLFIWAQLAQAAQVTLIKHDNSEIDGTLNKVTENAIFLSDVTYKTDKGSGAEGGKTAKSALFQRDDIKRIVYKDESKKTDSSSKTSDSVAVKSPISREKLIAMAEEGKKKYPSAGYITLIDKEESEYIDNKTNTSIYHGAYIIMKDDYKSLARIGSWVDDTRSKFHVVFGRIIYPDGTEFYMNPKDVVKSAPPGMGAAFFSSGSSIVRYNFPNPSAGCIVEYKTYRETFLPYIDDFFSNRFTFNGDQPVLSTEFEIIMPKEKKLYYVGRNLTEKELAPKISTKDGKTTYYWSLGEQKPIIAEPRMPANGDIAKIIYVSNQEKADFVMNWEKGMLIKNTKITPYIKDELKKILKGVSDDKEEILRHLYHWVQTKIRYVSVKSGSMSGMAGHPAEETLKNKFGDCVDKSVLFATLLRAAGIDANPISIKTNPSEEMENRIACFNANHSITEVFLNGKKLILDTTTTNYSYPHFRIDDHGVPVRSAYRNVVYRTPVPHPSNNASNYVRTMELSRAGAMKVDFEGNYTGPRSASLRGYYKTVPEKDLEKVFQRLASQDAPDAKLIDYSVENIYDLNKNMRLTYAYTSKEFTKKAGSLYILKNNSTLPYSFPEVSLKERKYDIEYMSSESRTNEDTYKLADSWRVEFLPAAVDIKNEYLHYTARWEQTGDNEIKFVNNYARFKRIVPVKDYDLYKKDIQKILDFESQNVLLSKQKVKNYADLLIMRDGIEADGELIKSTAEEIVFERKKDGKVLTLNPEDVLSVEIAKVSAPVKQTVDEIMDGPLSRALAFDTAADKYKGDHKIILLDSHKIRMNNDGTYTWTSRIITKILKEKGKAAGFDNWTYDPKAEKFSIDFGRTINGNDVTNLSSRTIQSKATISSYPEYKRLRNKKFALPEVKIGSILDYQVTRVVKTDPLHHIFCLPIERGSMGDSHTLDAGSNDSWKCTPNSFYASLPVVEKTIEIDVPASLKVDEAVINDADGIIEKQIVASGNRVVYLYKNSRVMDARPAEVGKPPVASYQPMILFSEKKSWQQIHNEIGKFYVPTREDRQAARELVAKLKEEGKTELSDIFEFMALEITHTGVELRDYSPIPGRVANILENKRGSDIDCAWLLMNLLQAFGAKAQIGFTPYLWFTKKHIKDHANIALMNTPLVYCKYRHKTLILNPIVSTLKMEESAANWDGRELLLVYPDGIRFLELNSSLSNTVTRTLKGSLSDDGTLDIASYKILPRGSDQSSYRGLRSVLKEKWPLIAQQSMTAGIHPNAVVKDFSYENIDDLKKDVKVEYKVEIPGYGKIAGDYILFKLPGVDYGMSPAASTETRETADIDLGIRDSSTRNYEITLPKGYSLYYAPKEIRLDVGPLSYKAKVVVKDALLTFTEKYQANETVFPQGLYEKYKTLSKTRADFSDEYIILKKK